MDDECAPTAAKRLPTQVGMLRANQESWNERPAVAASSVVSQEKRNLTGHREASIDIIRNEV